MNILKFEDYTTGYILNEGLICTYPINALERRFKRLLWAAKIDFKFRVDVILNICELILDSSNIHVYGSIVSTVNLYGYKVAQLLIDGKTIFDHVNSKEVISYEFEKCKIHILIESKFDKKFIPNEDFIYHVTLKTNLRNILEKGLIPNKLSYHRDRIYFSISVEFAKSFIKELCVLYPEIPELDYTILEINIANSHIDFMQDPNSMLLDGEVLGFYTFDNVSPEKIKILR